MGADLFQNLFIFEIANNHQGNLRHGLNLIRALGQVAAQEKIKAVVKFQFRQLDSFLSEHHRRNPNAMARRFLSTALTMQDFAALLAAVKEQNMLSMCTPFDEPSADQVRAMGFDFVKVASCSATDFPLLKKIAGLEMPTVASTAGLSLPQVDALVETLGAKQAPLAIMHCVALYPSENHELRLGRIAELRARFPKLSVGFSTHEHPDNFLAVQLAYAQGARLFEKHVGLPTEEVKLNAYSASPEQLTSWIRAWKAAQAACDSTSPPLQAEREASALRELKRACVASRPLRKGETLRAQDVSFSLSVSPEQLLVEDFREGIIAQRDYGAGDPIQCSDQISLHLEQLKSLLLKAGLDFDQETTVEISHHYGIRKFTEIGAFILPLPRDALRKILVLLPNQEHPIHFHENKNETFRVLHGSILLELDGRSIRLEKGEEILIPKESWHRFSSASGAVIEEAADITTLDSFYQDQGIQRMARDERKTFAPLA